MRVFGYDIRRPLWAVYRSGVRRTPPPAVGIPPADRFGVMNVSGFEVPSELGQQRPVPKPEELKVGSVETYDSTSLFYDAFESGGELVLIGPPLLNLAPLLTGASFSLDGVSTVATPRSVELDRVQLTRLKVPRPPQRLALRMGTASAEIAVQPSRHDIFRGRRVLVGKSKDNDLAWVEDWVDWHVRTQGVDAVLLYDNGSTKYSAEDVLARIRSVTGVEGAVVVEWPYKFGARGPVFSGDYSQYVVLEHARRRFLADAAGMVQLDIDELIVTDGAETVFDRLAKSPVGAVCFVGVWIDSVREGDGSVRHRDFRYNRKGDGEASRKWVAIPRLIPDAVQMTVHGFGKGFNNGFANDIRLRHFRAISTDWKYRRSGLIPFDRSVHEVDAAWEAQMCRVGWKDGAATPAQPPSSLR